MCGFVNLLLKFNIYVFSSKFKEFKYPKNDISSNCFKELTLIFIFLLVYGGIVMKMDKFHLFEQVRNFLFHT
jgi:hypothetical protein